MGDRSMDSTGNSRATEAVTIIHDVREWQKNSVQLNDFKCIPIDFSESDQWRFEEGQLRHQTGGFFVLAGISAEARHPYLNGQQQLIILQRQIAINGFLLRKTDSGTKILFQGRVEPGNVNGMQLAPTVQSTEANYKRLHGGRKTHFVEWFLDSGRAKSLFDELQSEEATRYHGKYNRNVVLQVPSDAEFELPDSFRWYGLEALRHFTVTDNVFNTDARSVLSCLDWGLLTGPVGAFARHEPDSFGWELRRSYCAGPDEAEHSDLDVLQWLTQLRVHCGLRTQLVRLEELANWEVGSNVIRERKLEHGFCARQFKVVATGREVRSWDQPLIDSSGVGRLTLVCQMRNNMLKFLVRASREIGFLEGVQLSASITILPGERGRTEDWVEQTLVELIAQENRIEIMHKCRQSEEGGRFFQDMNDYEIVMLDASVKLPESNDYRWITLSQIRRMIKIPGIFSIEFRGVFVLLIARL